MRTIGRQHTVIGSAGGREANERQIEVTVYAWTRPAEAVKRRTRGSKFLSVYQTGVIPSEAAVRVINIEKVIIRKPLFKNYLHCTI